MRRYLKYLVAVFFHYTGLNALCLRLLRETRPLMILMYHRVLDEGDPDLQFTQPGLYVTPRVFEEQVDYISRKFEIISLAGVSEMLAGGEPLPKNCAVVTFDDGWRDNYENAYPILKKHNISATIFLTTDYIGTGKRLWFYLAGSVLKRANLPAQKTLTIIRRAREKNAVTDSDSRGRPDPDDPIEAMKALDYDAMLSVIREIAAAAALPEIDLNAGDNKMLNWEQVTEMNKGGIEFGSHGISHRILTGLGRDEISEELRSSREIIERRLGHTIDAFSYPNGNYNPEIAGMVRAAGYHCAVTTSGYADVSDINIYGLNRIGVHQDISVGPNGRFSKAMFAFHLFVWSRFFHKNRG
jgi:peptidoglycan/xylan/chitin deacetylase (PgdA/CDA1 family)